MRSSLDRWADQIHAVVAKANSNAEREKLLTEFDALDERELASLTDKTLAFWQAKFPSDSPQALLATHEWQRRLTEKQVRATRFAAWIGLLGVVIGAILGASLTFLASDLSKKEAENANAQKRSGASSTEYKEAIQKPVAPPASGAVAPNQQPGGKR